jgi:pimeloyl-ACP methyl ester carboxylesterase
VATFVLVHGAWQGGWVWRELVPRLRARGHQALAPDLPGHGAETTPVTEITLTRYVDALVRLVSAVEEPAILVGHSLGGLVARVADLLPDRVRALVYLAAIVPPNGKAISDVMSGADPDYLATFVWADDRRSVRITPEGARKYLYPLAPSAIVNDVLPRLTAEPAAPFAEPLEITRERLASVPGYYIECLRDPIVPLTVQRDMQSNLPIRRTYSIDSDHSPFFSAPDELAAHLHAVAVEVA